MASQLPEAYWNSLGEHGTFLRALLDNQSQQLQHLQLQNQSLQEHLMNSQSNLANAASAAAIAAAQHIATPAHIDSTPSNRSIKAAEPEKFTGDKADTEGFT